MLVGQFDQYFCRRLHVPAVLQYDLDQAVRYHVGESVRTQQDQIVLLQFVAGRIYLDFCSGSQRPGYYAAYGCGPGFQFRIEAFID